ncbi:MAG: NDP-sugar synthase [Elusimicrobia bacterium]|nr:NDP-sugar synthase [Elusimicrobiota bacterium]
MKALILIGGLGTRLRPFTLDVPKSLLPIVNRPFLEYQLDPIRKAGIREVILCTAYRASLFKHTLGDGRRFGLKFHYIREEKPLGTGGAVKNAEKWITETTVVFNGDVLSGLNLKELIRTHQKNKAEATIALTRVKDPTLYGLVETSPDGKISRFLEKPSWDEVTTNTINAGTYVFEPSLTRLIPPGIPYSLERGLFPQLLSNGRRFHSHVAHGYWMDMGTVEKYLQAHLDILEGRTPFSPAGKRIRKSVWVSPSVRIGKEAEFEGKTVLGTGAQIGDFAKLSGNVVVGPRCRIGKGAQIENCVILAGTHIGDGARLQQCVVGSDCLIEPHVFIGPGRAVGDRSIIKKHSTL